MNTGTGCPNYDLSNRHNSCAGTAALVDTASMAVKVRDPDCYVGNPPLETAKRELEAAFNVVFDFLAKFCVVTSQLEFHNCFARFLASKVNLTRRTGAKK